MSNLLKLIFFRLGICSVPHTNPLNNHFMREEEKHLIGKHCLFEMSQGSDCCISRTIYWHFTGQCHQFLAWSQHSKTFLATNFPREGKKSPRVQRKEKQLRVLITVAIILISMDSFQVHYFMGTQVLPRLPTFLWRQFLLSTASCILQIRPERPF